MVIDVSQSSTASATLPADNGTPALPIDRDVFAWQWHAANAGHEPKGCLFCDPDMPLPSTFHVPTKPCCGVLLGDDCDCQAFAAEARGVFAQPIMCRPASQWVGYPMSRGSGR